MALALLIAILILGLALALVVARRRRRVPAPAVEPMPAENGAEREARHEFIEQRGTELLERRVDLDARRGTLTGDSGVNDAFDRLERRFRAGEISEDEFEEGKIRILGG